MKTINLTDIKVNEVIITKAVGYTVSILYSIIGDDDNQYRSIRVVLSDADLGVGAKTKLDAIFAGVITKIKTIEGI